MNRLEIEVPWKKLSVLLPVTKIDVGVSHHRASAVGSWQRLSMAVCVDLHLCFVVAHKSHAGMDFNRSGCLTCWADSCGGVWQENWVCVSQTCVFGSMCACVCWVSFPWSNKSGKLFGNELREKVLHSQQPVPGRHTHWNGDLSLVQRTVSFRVFSMWPCFSSGSSNSWLCAVWIVCSFTLTNDVHTGPSQFLACDLEPRTFLGHAWMVSLKHCLKANFWQPWTSFFFRNFLTFFIIPTSRMYVSHRIYFQVAGTNASQDLAWEQEGSTAAVQKRHNLSLGRMVWFKPCANFPFCLGCVPPCDMWGILGGHNSIIASYHKWQGNIRLLLLVGLFCLRHGS